MTREEAANIPWWASKRHYPGDQMDITAEDIEAFDMAIAALRSPTPDPDTGLVPCGCGGKARASTLSGRDDWFVECIKCHTTTYSNSKEGAEEKWDRAMGLLEVEE